MEYSDIFKDYKDMLFKSKKYWLIYLVLIAILGVSTINRNVAHPKLVILIFIIVAVLGIFSIVFYFLHDSDEELYKTAFIIILCFGIICALIVPICDVSDEAEHFSRAEITSQGVLIPHWIGEDMGVDALYNHTEGEKYSTQRNDGAGYNSILSIDFFMNSLGQTVYDTNHDTDKINYDLFVIDSAFEQNPFYGYLPQAIGILFAKLLDLNVIWMLWLARMVNLICYAALVAVAIRKTPVLKVPLLAVACIPIAIYQASSTSIDSMIIGLSVLSIAYFIYMCKAPENSITIKEIAVFSIICVLLGLCKLPYLAFIFLLLFVPFNNYQNEIKNVLPVLLISIAAVSVIGLLWSSYSAPLLEHSWRSANNLINSTLQLNYVANHPNFLAEFLYNVFAKDLPNIITGVFSFYGSGQEKHYTDTYYLITVSILAYLAITLFAYPKNTDFELKTKLGSLFVILLIFIGTCFIQLLTWANVGQLNLGVSARYFVPLALLFPVVLSIRNPLDSDEFDKYAIVIMIAFMAVLILSFATKYY